MFTTFILHGGRSSKKKKINNDSFKAIIRSAKNGKILIVCFARPKKDWKRLFEQEKERFNFSRRKLEFILASDKPHVFKKQIKEVNAIFIKGGHTYLVKKRLERIKDFKRLIMGKTIAGSSAGANVFAKYYYSSHSQTICKGLGILPIKVFAHYSLKLKKERDNLDNYKEKLRMVILPEGKFVVIKTNL